VLFGVVDAVPDHEALGNPQAHVVGGLGALADEERTGLDPFGPAANAVGDELQGEPGVEDVFDDDHGSTSDIVLDVFGDLNRPGRPHPSAV
jgi:hypothetical protein